MKGAVYTDHQGVYVLQAEGLLRGCRHSKGHSLIIEQMGQFRLHLPEFDCGQVGTVLNLSVVCTECLSLNNS